MLDHLRQKVVLTLASVDSVMISSCGPADIQSSRVPCASQDLTLYVFIPSSSDHLLNLEQRSGIVVATDEWNLQGTAQALAINEIPAGVQPSGVGTDLFRPAAGSNSASGCVTVAIRPTRLTFHSRTGLGNVETIDF